MNKISYYIRRIKEEIKIIRIKKQLDLSDVTLLSQNCIGGVMYHDCQAQFLSPTVNLYMPPCDFIKFVNNYEDYLSYAPVVTMGETYPMGYLKDNLQVNFMHYESVEDALTKWETRKTRIRKDRIFVICIERDGFDERAFKAFQEIEYPKVLFTRNIKWKDEKNCIFMSKYQGEDQVPDLIPGRMMYYKNKLPKLIKKAFDKK